MSALSPLYPQLRTLVSAGKGSLGYLAGPILLRVFFWKNGAEARLKSRNTLLPPPLRPLGVTPGPSLNFSTRHDVRERRSVRHGVRKPSDVLGGIRPHGLEWPARSKLK